MPPANRNVNNIYLDTSEFDCFNLNVDGSASRSKFRIRWYGETTGIVAKPKLEVKSKENLVGAKEAYPLPSFTLDPDFTIDPTRCVGGRRITHIHSHDFIGLPTGLVERIS